MTQLKRRRQTLPPTPRSVDWLIVPKAPKGRVLIDVQETAEKKPSRVKIIVSKRDADGTPIETEELPKSQQENLVEHAFILRKTVHPPGRSDDDYSEIDISSPGLWDLMKELLGWYPYHVFRDSPTTLYSPFE